MIRNIKALSIFLAVCLLLGMGVQSGPHAHFIDVAWISLVWTFIIVAGISVLLRIATRWRAQNGIASTANRGLWLLPLPRGVLRWLFDTREPDQTPR